MTNILGVFVDLDFYASVNPDLAAAGLSNEQLLEHLQTFGIAEGRQFSPIVDLEFYRNSYADLASLSNEQLLEHLQLFGLQEGRRFSPVVDLNLYLNNNADLQIAFGNDRKALLEHLVYFGISEERTLSRNLDLRNYLALNADVDAAVGGSLEGALEHLLSFGLREGREGALQSFAADSLQIQTAQQLFELFQGVLTNPSLTEDIRELQTANAYWNIAGDIQSIPYATRYATLDAIERSFFTLLATYYPTQFEPLEFIQEGNRVAVRIAQAGLATQTGDPFESDFVYLLTVGNDGLVASLDAFYNTYPLAAAVADQAGPAIPEDDPLTGQPVTINTLASPEVSRQVAVAMWESLINQNFNTQDPLSFLNLNAPDTVWSFAVGGPDFLPYAQAAQGVGNVTGDFNPANGFGIIDGLLSTVQPGSLSIEETFAEGNRVVLRLRAQNAVTGVTRYDLDLISLITVEDGQVQSNQVIVDTYPTVEALRPDTTFPLSPEPSITRRSAPYFVTGSIGNSTLVSYDQQGNFLGVFNDANNPDTPEFLQPLALTYGPDGNIYINSSSVDTQTGEVASSVIRFDGVFGDFLGVYGDASLDSGLLVPSGIKFGPDDNLYVSSSFNSRILRYAGPNSDNPGQFLGLYAERNNGFPDNTIDPVTNSLGDFTAFVFGPDDNIYIGSLREDPDGITENGFGSILQIAGPNSVNPGEILGVFGQANSVDSPLSEPAAVAFGPDLNLYASSAATGDVLVYAGPTSNNPGQFLGVFADVESAVRNQSITDLPFSLSGIGFGPDGNLYVGSTFEQLNTGAPTGGSQTSIFAGPTSANPGVFLGTFGQASTEYSRIQLPTTPEFVFFDNSYTEPTPTPRFPQISFVVGANTDRPFDAATGTPGFFLPDETDALAAYDRNGIFLGFLGAELTNASLSTDLTSANNPLDGVGGITLATSGNILVSSQLSNEVLEYDSLTGEFIGIFGDASSQGSGLNFPTGIALGPDNNIYVNDLGNERILRFDGVTGILLGTAAQGNIADNREERFTDLEFGPDGLLYVGSNPPLDAVDNLPPALGQGQVRVYNPDTGRLVNSITGLDFAAGLTFGPDDLLYISDDPSSVIDFRTGQPVAAQRQGRVIVYDIDNFRGVPQLVRSFDVGVGNAGGISVSSDATIYLSNPASGTISLYNSIGQTLGLLGVPIPNAALAVDENGLPRPSSSTFITEAFV